MSYVYIKSAPGLFTVGFYDPLSQFHADSDHDTRDAAAARVHYLNGGGAPERGRIARDYYCQLCGQHITDGKPCGCGARR